MKLSKKTLIYSCMLAIVMVAFIVGYFTLMLPALYVSYTDERNYQDIVAIHEKYMKNASYDNIKVKNSTSTCTIELPKNPRTITLKNSYIDMTININNEKIYKNLSEVYEKIDNQEYYDDDLQSKEFENYFNEIEEELKWDNIIPEDYPVKIHLAINNNAKWSDESNKVLKATEKRLDIKTSVTDGSNYYTAYFIIEKADEKVVITLMSVITPQMEEIRPIVLQSLPMIIAVIIFIVLISSQFFSKKIVNPIVNLANHAMNINLDNHQNLFINQYSEMQGMESENEIEKLRGVLANLYEKLHESYAMLEEKNKMLEKENERQQVFLRASSHQLKTPIAAALLLVDGMIDEVGKYKDTKENLPKVKEQILSMKKIVEEILYLNHSTDNMTVHKISLNKVVEQTIILYQVQMSEKNLQAEFKNHEPVNIIANEEIVEKIIDNLMSNAVRNSPDNGKIEIHYDNKEGSLTITNYGETIPDELMPHIFEPFVSSDKKQKGKGLGLYVVQWYARLLKIDIEINNLTDACGVEVKLTFHNRV